MLPLATCRISGAKPFDTMAPVVKDGEDIFRRSKGRQKP